MNCNARRLRCHALLLLGLFTACGGTTWQTIDFEGLASSKDYPNAHGVVLEDVGEATFGVEEGRPYHEMTVRRRVRLLTERARQSYDDLRIQYDGQLSTLTEVAARIVKPGGTSISVEEWSDHPASSSSGLHTTTRLRVADLSSASPGDVIEMRWRLRSYDAFLGHGWSFESSWPTMLSRLTLTLPPGAEIATSFIERGEYRTFEPKREALPNGGSRLTWERVKRPPAPKTVTYAPPRRARQATVTYSVRKLPGAGVKEGILTSWKDYGTWYASLIEGTDEVTPRIESIAAKVLADAPEEPKQRVGRLYRHVQDTIRYVSIQLGMGGWRPTPADEVAEQALGDCKDMASYLKALLSTDGIDSNLVVLGTRSTYLTDTPGPNLRGHNHVILAVNLPGQDPHFLDATCRTCGFNDLPWGDQGTQVLIADGSDSRLVRTPVSAPQSNRRVRHYEVELAADGSATFRLDYETTGESAKRARAGLFVMNSIERERWLRRVPGGHGAVETTATEIGHQEDFDTPLRLHIEGRFGSLAKGSGDLWTLGVSSFIRPPMARLAKKRAELPAHLGYPRATEMVARVTLPEGFRVGSAPDPVVVESPFGRYERRYVVEEGTLIITRTFEQTATVVPAEQVSKLRTFSDDVLAHDRDTVVLTRK